MDKIKMAEWKLAGLCELCGADPDNNQEWTHLGPVEGDSMCLYKNTSSWEKTDNKCYDKINFRRYTDEMEMDG